MATNDPAQTPAANAALTFDNDQVTTGTNVFHSSSTGTFALLANGFYEIQYHTEASSAPAAALPATVSLHLVNGGEIIPGTTSSARITEENNSVPLSGTAIIEVTTYPTNITLVSGNADGSFSNTSVTIRKLD